MIVLSDYSKHYYIPSLLLPRERCPDSTFSLQKRVSKATILLHFTCGALLALGTMTTPNPLYHEGPVGFPARQDQHTVRHHAPQPLEQVRVSNEAEYEELPDEHCHFSQRAPWLRASVLGANDGLVSNASLMLGIGGGSSELRTIVLAGVAGLVAGSLSMACGEYISVSSQKDSELADIEQERREQVSHRQNLLCSLATSLLWISRLFFCPALMALWWPVLRVHPDNVFASKPLRLFGKKRAGFWTWQAKGPDARRLKGQLRASTSWRSSRRFTGTEGYRTIWLSRSAAAL